jgi:hypothetical protein
MRCRQKNRLADGISFVDIIGSCGAYLVANRSEAETLDKNDAS